MLNSWIFSLRMHFLQSLILLLCIHNSGGVEKWWNNNNIVNTDCNLHFDSCYSNLQSDLRIPPDHVQYCRYLNRYHHCMFSEVTCMSDPILARNLHHHHQEALQDTISCSLGLACSSTSMYMCLGELENDNVLRVFLPTNPQVNHVIQYNDDTCRKLSKALVCMTELPDNCRAAWLSDDYYNTLSNALSADCNNTQQQLSTTCHGMLEHCVGSDIYNYLLDLSGSLFLTDKEFCVNLPKAYECIESLRDQCPPDLYELDDVIGSYTDPGTTLISDCITIVGGGGTCRDVLRDCIGTDNNDVYDVDRDVRCRAYYHTLQCYHSMLDSNPECFENWWRDAMTLRARNTLAKICPVKYDKCTIDVLSCVSDLNTDDDYHGDEFCVYSGAVYKCVSKHKHCTLNHNIYNGPEDPTVLQHQLAQQCDGDFTSTSSRSTLNIGMFLLMFKLCICCYLFY